jgi:hypothetical protein
MFALLTAGALLGQDETQYPGWMKTVGGNLGATRKAIDSKSADAAVSAAKIAEAFDKVHGFWQAKGTQDAQQLAASAKAAALDVAKHAQAGDFEKASQSMGSLAGTCKGCHEAHREKAADGSWKIK